MTQILNPRPAHPPAPEIPSGPLGWAQHPMSRMALVLVLLYVFLIGVNSLGAGFNALSADLLNSFFRATENPFLALMIGILATTLVQSSSVTTAAIVGLVAAPENPLPVANAIPMIMGANIGTTVTNTIASLAHMGRREEFRRAFAVATCHDFFNYFTVLLLLPLELFTGIIGRSAAWLSHALGDVSGADYDSPFKNAIKAGGKPIEALADTFASGQAAAVIVIVISAVLLVVTLLSIVSVMRRAMHTRVESLVSRALENRAIIAMLIGAVATVMVQSSSITTSLLVPLAGAGILTLPQAFPITLGANIGTTITALLAAMAASDENAEAGLTIALVHLLFNVGGILLIYPVRRIRNLPIAAARKLADIAVRSRAAAILYVVLLFYAIPAAFAILSRFLG